MPQGLRHNIITRSVAVSAWGRGYRWQQVGGNHSAASALLTEFLRAEAQALLHSIDRESVQAHFFTSGVRLRCCCSFFGLSTSDLKTAASANRKSPQAEANVFTFTATSSAAEKAGALPFPVRLGSSHYAPQAQRWRTAADLLCVMGSGVARERDST